MGKLKIKTKEEENKLQQEARDELHHNYEKTFEMMSEQVKNVVDKYAHQINTFIQQLGGNFDHLAVLPHRELLQLCQRIVKVRELQNAGISLEDLIGWDPDQRLETLEYAMPIRMLMKRHNVTIEDIFSCEPEVRRDLFNFWEEIEECCEGWNVTLSDILSMNPDIRKSVICKYYELLKAIQGSGLTFRDFMTLEPNELNEVLTHPHSMAAEKIVDSMKT